MDNVPKMECHICKIPISKHRSLVIEHFEQVHGIEKSKALTLMTTRTWKTSCIFCKRQFHSTVSFQEIIKTIQRHLRSGFHRFNNAKIGEAIEKFEVTYEDVKPVASYELEELEWVDHFLNVSEK